jgi:hypothetical protein
MEKRLVPAVVKTLGDARCLCVADEWKICPFFYFRELVVIGASVECICYFRPAVALVSIRGPYSKVLEYMNPMAPSTEDLTCRHLLF